MKVAVVRGPGKVSLVEMPRPSPRRGEVLVRMACCGVCGTDLEKVLGGEPSSRPLGHEVVGEVVEAGDGAPVLPGTRVFTHHHVPCMECGLCLKGKHTYCERYTQTNLVPCGLAEYYIVPGYNVERGAILKLPDSLGYEEASFIEPLACCILGLKEAGARTVATAVVYGSGPVGLMHVKLMKLYGVRRVAVADLSSYRLEFARRAGADAVFRPGEEGERANALRSIGGAPDLAVLATGSSSAFEEAVKTVGRTGKVLLFGVPKRGAAASLDLSGYFASGVEIRSSYAATEKETAEALDLLAERKLTVGELVTHRFRLEESDAAFRVAAQQLCLKALIKP